jgi:ABC-type nitrate/sulfonate/bicarbonate transport system permease component
MNPEQVSMLGVHGLITPASVVDVTADRTAALPERPPLGLSQASKERIILFVSPFLILLLWEIMVRAGVLDKRFFPAPTSIWSTFQSLAWVSVALTASTVPVFGAQLTLPFTLTTGELWIHIRDSLSRIAIGFVIGAVPALILGVIMGLNVWVRAALGGWQAALYPIPKIAILPLIMLIFGLGDQSKWAIIAIGVFFPMLYATTLGVQNIPNIYLDVGRNFGARTPQFFWTVALPGALPSIMTGIKLSTGVALLVIVSAEMLAAKSGLGYMIWQAWQTFSVERMYVGLVVISALGILINVLLVELEHKLIPWRV